MREFLVAGLAMGWKAERGFEALARALDGLSRQGVAGSALRCTAVGSFAREDIADRLGGWRMLGIECEHLGNAAGRAVLFAADDGVAVKPSRIQQIRNAILR